MLVEDLDLELRMEKLEGAEGRPLLVVFKGHPDSAEQACMRLEGASLTPYVVDRVTLISKITSMGTLRVRVAVPEEEADRAAEVLDAWEDEAEVRVAEAGASAKRQLLLSFLAPAVYIAARYAWSHAEGQAFGLGHLFAAGAIWLLALAILGRTLK